MTMYTTVNFYGFRDLFKACGRGDQFSADGLRALFDYLEEYEKSTGEQIELDVIGLCCDYAEYDSIIEAYTQLCGDELEGDDYDEREENAREWLYENGTLLEFNGGVICAGY
jgi:hypothetical protein